MAEQAEGPPARPGVLSLAAECRRQGYEAAKDELRTLLAKVPEKDMIGVVAAWLHEGEDHD